MEFDYSTYTEFLMDLQSKEYTFEFFDDPGGVLLRHDVDWSPHRALRMAEIEAEHGILSTYFFLLTSPLYNVFAEETRKVISDIEALGHRVGLHFSTHQYFDSQPLTEAVIEQVTREIQTLARVTERNINTVSFHMPPKWILDTSFPEFQNTYAPEYFSEIEYRADSSQRWRDENPLANPMPEAVQYLVHPGLWGESDQEFETRLATVRNKHFDRVSSFLDTQYLEDDAKGALSNPKKLKPARDI